MLSVAKHPPAARAGEGPFAIAQGDNLVFLPFAGFAALRELSPLFFAHPARLTPISRPMP